MIDINAVKEYMLNAAICDGEAYRDNKNAKLAVQRARHAAVREIYSTIVKATDEVVAALQESWTDESLINEAKRKVDLAFWEAMKTGAVVRAPERIYDEQLEILPPAWMRGHHFAVGEPYTHSKSGEPVHAFFWKENDGPYWAQYLTLTTRRNLSEIERQAF